MNRSLLHKLNNQRVRVRPIARRFDDLGNELPGADDVWSVSQAHSDGVVLINHATNHILGLAPEHIRSYMAEVPGRTGFLLLNVQVFLQGRKVHKEPLAGAAQEPFYVPVVSAPSVDPSIPSSKGGSWIPWVVGAALIVYCLEG